MEFAILHHYPPVASLLRDILLAVRSSEDENAPA
jgi:hypothetical protein